MRKPLELGPSLFLVSVGNVNPAQITDMSRDTYPANGLLLQQPTTSGAPVELFIATDADLAAWANLRALSILKPIVLPLTLAEVRPGRINAYLREDPQSHALAAHILNALLALHHPAQPAGVSPSNCKKGH